MSLGEWLNEWLDESLFHFVKCQKIHKCEQFSNDF